MKNKKIGFGVLSITLLGIVGCSNNYDVSNDLIWNGGNGNDVELLNVPTGFKDTSADSPTPINATLSGSILDGGACQAKLLYIDIIGNTNFVTSPSFITYRGSVDTSTPYPYYIAGLAGPDPIPECVGLSGTLNISFNVKGKTYEGFINRQF